MRLIDIEDVSLLKTVTDGGLSAKALWRRIKQQPVIDAVPVRYGKWIHKWSGDGSTWLEQRCSECGMVMEEEPIDYNFCPMCGARMDKDEAD